VLRELQPAWDTGSLLCFDTASNNRLEGLVGLGTGMVGLRVG